MTGHHKGEPLATLSGQLRLAEGVSVNSDVHLSIAWYPDLNPTNATLPRDITTEEVSFSGRFPQDFRFRLYAPPTAAARAPVLDEQGQQRSEFAIGQLIAWEDTDGDGALTRVDRILGASSGAGAFDFFANNRRDVIAWVRREDDLGLAGMHRGYNRLRFEGPFAPPTLVTDDTVVPLTLSGDPRLALLLCPEAYASSDVEFACGVRVWSTPGVSGSLSLQEDGRTDAFVAVTADGAVLETATLRLNGVEVPFDPNSQAHVLFETTPSTVRIGRNELVVSAPGYEPTTLEVTVPPRFEVTAPRAGTQLTAGSDALVEWTAPAGATQFSVSLNIDAPEFPSVSDFVGVPRATLRVPDAVGPAQLSVVAFDRLGLGRAAVAGLSTRTIALDVVR